MIRAAAIGTLLLGLSSAGLAFAAGPDCLEKCEAKREQARKLRQRCIEAGESLFRDEAVKHRLNCRRKYPIPRCQGLPRCPKKKKVLKATPGLTLGKIVFSSTRRGTPLSQASYAAGSQLFIRVETTVVSRPKQSKLWLQLNLRLLARGPGGKARVVASWNKYLEKQKFLEVHDRQVPLKYTLHGGATLPPNFKPGAYKVEVEVKELAAPFTQKATRAFRVTK